MSAEEAVRLSRVRALTADGQAERIRRDARLSRAEMAAACKVSESAIYQWEKGARSPRGAAALRYGDLLDRLSEALVG